ncbi:hypothetical protein I7X12_09540 [Halosimplex litoreum]|uniref:Uncharacterized protein n=1 Tax=Halosimplex litoreum TaxID=1198301 RepID=A0A7U3WB26_9EURY|nr:hypothetical protein [Halosimplex litoreum]QPV64821.1 hypothetical protein I7X12_09540 [Halosimplex litoreum]
MEPEVVIVVLVGLFVLGGGAGLALANVFQFVGWVGGLVYLLDRARATVQG